MGANKDCTGGLGEQQREEDSRECEDSHRSGGWLWGWTRGDEETYTELAWRSKDWGSTTASPGRFLLGLTGHSAAWEVTVGLTLGIFLLWYV